MPGVLTIGRRLAAAALGIAAALSLSGCGTPGRASEGANTAAPAVTDADSDALVIVAVDDSPDPLPGAARTPRPGYRGSAGYAGGSRGASTATAVASTHGLVEEAAWTIAPLGLRCMVYRLAPGTDRKAALATIAGDTRVRLVQPMNSFETLAAPAGPVDATGAPMAPPTPAGDDYNDPYFRLQRGFAAMNAAEAQRWSRGRGVRVALIDTGVDTGHPDLAGRIDSERDFVNEARPAAPGGERHGTQMAGVIAAGANNRVGIVGIAPQATLLVYRACWSLAAPPGAARCDSFTLARALSAAIAAGADVINLSLGGPADPLLQRLAEHALQGGAIVVGALPANGRAEGFPAGVPGVLVVASSDEAPGLVVTPAAATGAMPAAAKGSTTGPIPTPTPTPERLAAPGRDILTLTPGGHYDFASGSSLAAAHVTGAVALLRALDRGVRADTAGASLHAGSGPGAGSVDACAALRMLHELRGLRDEAPCGSAVGAAQPQPRSQALNGAGALPAITPTRNP